MSPVPGAHGIPGEGARFAPAAGAWLARIGSLRDTVRQTLVADQLGAHLPAGAPLDVLDAGCGQGTQAIALARLGHAVTGLDASDELLRAARDRAASEPAEVRARLTWTRGDVLALAGAHDVVCCHGVAMYLPSLAALCAALVGAARPGGLVSLLTRNRAGIAMRAGMTGRFGEAVRDFDATHYVNRLGVRGARADDPADVRDALAAAGARTVAWYGVRLFSDHLDGDASVDDLDGLIAAEREAGRRDPYRALAALTHTLAAVG